MVLNMSRTVLSITTKTSVSTRLAVGVAIGFIAGVFGGSYGFALLSNKLPPGSKPSIKPIVNASSIPIVKPTAPSTLIAPKTVARLLVIPIYDGNKYQQAPVPTFSIPQLQEGFFTGNKSLRSFYQRETLGALYFTGDVVSPIGIKLDQYDATIKNGDILILLNAVGNQVDFSKYTYFTLVPIDTACLIGSAYQGVIAQNTVQGVLNIGLSLIPMQTCNSFPFTMIYHETGHMLGLKHTEGWKCKKDVPASLDEATVNSCIAPYYDDTLMGGNTDEININQRIQLGAPYFKQEVKQAGDYELSASSRYPAGTHELIITGDGGYYSLEFQTVAFAQTVPNAKSGVVIRFAPLQNYWYQEQSLRMGGDPGYAYQTGMTFTDQTRNLSISVLSMTEDSAVVHISK